jgi:hypothetical protein
MCAKDSGTSLLQGVSIDRVHLNGYETIDDVAAVRVDR